MFSGFNFLFGWNDLFILFKFFDFFNCNVLLGINVFGINFFVFLGVFFCGGSVELIIEDLFVILFIFLLFRCEFEIDFWFNLRKFFLDVYFLLDLRFDFLFEFKFKLVIVYLIMIMLFLLFIIEIFVGFIKIMILFCGGRVIFVFGFGLKCFLYFIFCLFKKVWSLFLSFFCCVFRFFCFFDVLLCIF